MSISYSCRAYIWRNHECDEQDYLLPRSITLRLAKSVLPPNTSVQKDAVLAIQKAATVFVSYLSSHANESTLKRTVSPADVLDAISELEFEGFRPRLERELDVFTNNKAAKRRPKKGDAGAGEAGGEAGGAEQGEGQTVAEPGSGEKKEVVVRGVKRVKMDGNGGEVEVEDEEDQDHDMEDEGEAEEVEEEHDEDATEEEEEEDEGDDEAHEDEDIDRVEDLDHRSRMTDPDAGGDTDSDEEGPGSQLRGDLGLG
ncbi:histone-fold-containing protein [Aspergillus oleicola]